MNIPIGCAPECGSLLVPCFSFFGLIMFFVCLFPFGKDGFWIRQIICFCIFCIGLMIVSGYKDSDKMVYAIEGDSLDPLNSKILSSTDVSFSTEEMSNFYEKYNRVYNKEENKWYYHGYIVYRIHVPYSHNSRNPNYVSPYWYNPDSWICVPMYSFLLNIVRLIFSVIRWMFRG